MTGLRAQDHSGNKDQGPVVGTQRWDSGNSVPRLYKSWYVSWASGRLPLPGERAGREAQLEALVSNQQQKKRGNMEGSFALLRRGNMHRGTGKGTG